MSEQALSLGLFAAVMTFSPGPNNVLLAWSGSQVGLRRSIPLWLGIVVGIVVLLTVSALGPGTVLKSEPLLQRAMLGAGSLYLAWLGWKVARSGPPTMNSAGHDRQLEFIAGLVNTLLNPKGWAMALGATAGYATLAPTAPHLALVLSLVFAAMAVPNWLLWCGGGQALARSVTSERGWRLANGILGSLVVASIVPLWLE
ncbi:MAG TPA: LysE family translocator [Thermomicrobiales bacterium]|nr:LysE family translocator [Thermomicrobiales bacterium]